jgi:hypothetical protein
VRWRGGGGATEAKLRSDAEEAGSDRESTGELVCVGREDGKGHAESTRGVVVVRWWW